MGKEVEQVRKLVGILMWHMRGSLSRDEAWTLSPEERRDIVAAIEERKEMTEKTGLPLM
jgi:hypothetical protein